MSDILKVPTKQVLGVAITNTNPVALSEKLNEVITVVNDLNDGTINTTNIALTGTLDVDGVTTLGASTPTTVSAAGVVAVASVTDATTKDTGSIITEGGIGVEKAVFAGTSVTATTQLRVSATTNQIRLGDIAAFDTIISSTAPAADRVITIPDPGAAANFVLSEGAATINGAKTFGSVILAPDGTAALPAYSFTTDPNTGIYSISGDVMGFATNGTEKWRLSGGDLIPAASNYDIGSTGFPVYREYISYGIHPYGAAYGATGAGVTSVHYGDGKDITTVLTLTNAAIGTVGVANKAIGAVVFTFPAGVHVHTVSYFSVGLSNSGGADASTPVVALGSLVGSGVVAVLHATNALMDDYTSESAVADVNATAEVVGPVGAVAGLMTGISLNGAADTKVLNFNAAGAWGVAGDITATGTVVIKWTKIV